MFLSGDDVIAPAPTLIRRRSSARLPLLAALLVCAGLIAAPESPAEMLARADRLKTSSNPEFVVALEELKAQRAELSAAQRDLLRYLEGWQLAYLSEYDRAVEVLGEVARSTTDNTLRFRAEASTANVLTIARRYQPALTHLNSMLALLPSVQDPEIRGQGLLTAAFLHIQVGQFDLALRHAEQLIRSMPAGKVACAAAQLKVEAQFKQGRLSVDDSTSRQALAECNAAGEVIFANLIRTFMARTDLKSDQPDDALALLNASYDEVKSTRYPRLIADYEAVLAQAWWQKGNLAQSESFAKLAIERGAGKDLTEPLVDANRLLYLIARERGNDKAALAFHETFAAADKRFLDDIGARELAYQMVKSQQFANEMQIEALNKRNQVLNLQRELGAKAVETGRLYIALLLTVLASFVFWLWRTKRSELRFMKLARRDGLTGILNHAHFGDTAQSMLDYCRKSNSEACMILIDLDHFKRVNDQHGHAAGDTVLRRTVDACVAHLRSVDIMGRLGGEEFGILLPECDVEEGRRMAEQLRLTIAGLPHHEAGIPTPVTASFGMSSTRWSGHDLRELTLQSDRAMYEAKDKGRDRVVLFDGSSAAPPVPIHEALDRRRA